MMLQIEKRGRFMFKKFKFIALTLSALFFCTHVFAAPPESTCKLADKLKMDSEQLHSLLISKDEKKELVPMTSKYQDFYTDLYSNPENAEHMKYYGHGTLSTEDGAKKAFEGRLSRMWNSDTPNSLAFILLSEGEPAGFIGVGPLRCSGVQPEIGRVIDKKFAGKGLGTFCAQTVVSLLQSLKTSGIYNYSHLISTSKPENLASRNSVLKAGFVTDEKIITTPFGPEKMYRYEFK